MMQKLQAIIMVILLLPFFCEAQELSIQPVKPSSITEEKLAQFLNKESVNIVVTDSGLGGVSVAADVVERLKTTGVFAKAKVIFFNAQPYPGIGYNSMESTEEKVRVFNNALDSIENKLKPDIILVACNTLSVLYEYTDHSKNPTTPVVSIVGTGIGLISSKLRQHKDAGAIIFATQTTVSQGNYRAGLIKLGFSKEDIVAQACPHLARSIEIDPKSTQTRSIVSQCVDNAVAKTIDDGDIFVSYNCTHYGYVDNLFKAAFSAGNIRVKEFLNPNPFMADFIFADEYLNRYKATDVNVEIISQAEIPPDRQNSIHGLIKPLSSQTADAIFHYKHEPDFFQWKYGNTQSKAGKR